jgi:DNA-binding CsgD family transcriptional regulator
LVISINSQMNQLILQAAGEISQHQEEIKLAWERFFQRLKQNESLIDMGPDELKILKQITELFWDYIPKFNSSSLENILQNLQADWENQHVESFHAHKFILLFTVLEQQTHTIIKNNGLNDVQLHQAIQHFFSLFVQQILLQGERKSPNIEEFVSQLFQKAENPFLWCAKISKANNGYKLERFTANQNLNIDETWSKMMTSLQGPSLELLADAIQRLLSGITPEEELEVIPFSIDGVSYLFGIHRAEGEKLKPIVSLFLKLLKQNEHMYETLQVKNDWKDSLILFDEWIMLARNFQEAIEKVGSGFTTYLPFQRAALFYYTKAENGEDIGIGMMGHQIETKEIRNIRENLSSVPHIIKTLRHIQPLYLPKAEMVLPNRFVKQFSLESLVIVPIYSAYNSQILGAVFLDQGEGEQFTVSSTMLTVITKFGQHAGEILAKYSPDNETMWSLNNKSLLTHREVEILRLIAKGNSIEEVADFLFLSRYTVRDYMSNIKKKLNAQNRTQAIAKAIRQGLI